PVSLEDVSEQSRDPDQPAQPFLKWAGGKRRLLPDLIRHLPEEYGTYFEPFLGGGALFFAVRPSRGVLSDTNERLVRTWKTVRDAPEALIEKLSEFPHDEEFFLQQRKRDIDVEEDVEVAAWMLYLNKTAYNGLYRVNSKGGFNVPFGRYENPTICDEGRIRHCSEMLSGVAIHHRDFTVVLEEAQRGDFVYFDPPYVPLSESSSFTGYTRDGFTLDDQARLRDLASALKKRGVCVLLSNSSAPQVHELYADGFEVREVQVSRAINSKASGRGKIAELLIR
ncbi:MAG: DNA adenine methylase, partial [Myxococcota bacterium]|nr:DNA adenine methylase [Myxococcota bacterium]